MDKKMSHKKKGKMAALSELRDAMSGMMKDDMGDVKKVSVMAKDKKGLKAGLEKAEDMLGEKGVMTEMDKKRYMDDEDEDEE